MTKILEPYRARIDALDRKIVDLLAERYGIIDEVGHLKAREGIAATLQDRVDEVRENAGRMAEEKNLDADFIRALYAQLIAHSCETEERIIESLSRKRRKA